MMMVIMPTPLFLPWVSWRWLLLLMDTKWRSGKEDAVGRRVVLLSSSAVSKKFRSAAE